jgi:hypothetical protein
MQPNRPERSRASSVGESNVRRGRLITYSLYVRPFRGMICACSRCRKIPSGLPHRNRLPVLNRNLSFVPVITWRGSRDSAGILVGWLERICAARAEPSYCQSHLVAQTHRMPNHMNPTIILKSWMAGYPQSVQLVCLQTH